MNKVPNLTENKQTNMLPSLHRLDYHRFVQLANIYWYPPAQVSWWLILRQVTCLEG